MKSILVTGSNGQLGRCIKDVAQSSKDLNFIFTDNEELDITNKEEVNTFFENNPISYCMNCAAYTAVDKAESNKKAAEAVNVLGVKNLAKACAENEAILIHISTDFVFEGKQTTPYSELDKAKPLNVYGLTKLKGEKVIQKLLERYFIIRTSWLYSEYESNFLKTMLKLSKEKNELHVVSDAVGTPTYARELAKVIIGIIEKKETAYGLYHYSNEGETSWYDFARTIFDLSNIEIKISPIRSNEYPTKAERPRYSVMDKTKTKSTLGIKIPYWEESLKECIKRLTLGK